jgi:TrmH family RNA methyltransferase
MLGKSKIKLINSLKLKKYRKKHRLFTAEGEKTIKDFLDTDFNLHYLIVRKNFENRQKLPAKAESYEVSEHIMKKLSNFKNPPDVFAVFEIPEYPLPGSEVNNQLSLYCDTVQDPGNLGTIIRTAAWFGIHTLFCSEDTADMFNPKVIQASMGAVAKSRLHYVNAKSFFEEKISPELPVFGADLEGENIHEADLPAAGIIVMGNEGQGIGRETQKYVSRQLYIPNFSDKGKQPESLNVAAAAAIICSEFRRRNKTTR